MNFDQTAFDSVCQQAREAMLFHSAADTLEWDERTGMPPAAGAYRAEQIATLRARTHQLKTDPRYGEQLRQLAESVADEPHSDRGATVIELLRDWQRDRKLPTDLVERISNAAVRGQQSWDAARQANDFSLFRNQLAEMVKLKREAGSRLAEDTDRTVYEALLDDSWVIAATRSECDHRRVPDRHAT